jgi:hypothetical protein
MGDVGDEEASETVADLPRFEADADAVREADLRAAAAATAARDGVPARWGPEAGQRQAEDHDHRAVGDGRRATRAAREAATHRRAVGPARARETRNQPNEAVSRRSRLHAYDGQIAPSASVRDHHHRAASTASAGVPGQLPGSLRQTQQPARGGHDLRVAVRRCGHSCAARRMPTMPGGGARVPEDVLLDGCSRWRGGGGTRSWAARRKATLTPNPRRIGSRTAPADASSGG